MAEAQLGGDPGRNNIDDQVSQYLGDLIGRWGVARAYQKMMRGGVSDKHSGFYEDEHRLYHWGPVELSVQTNLISLVQAELDSVRVANCNLSSYTLRL